MRSTPLRWAFAIAAVLVVAGLLVGGTGAESTKDIVGTARADTLRGTPGNDTISGLAGNDKLYGLGGKDVLNGGAGNDVLYGGGGKDVLRCGPGQDVAHADAGDKVARDCEKVLGLPKPAPPAPPPPPATTQPPPPPPPSAPAPAAPDGHYTGSTPQTGHVNFDVVNGGTAITNLSIEVNESCTPPDQISTSGSIDIQGPIPITNLAFSFSASGPNAYNGQSSVSVQGTLTTGGSVNGTFSTDDTLVVDNQTYHCVGGPNNPFSAQRTS